jgi:hypothetical protein
VIARDVQAEVYRVHQGESVVYEYWGCVYGSRKRFRLGTEQVSGSPYGSLYIKNVTLANTTVAYETLSASYAGSGEVIESLRYVMALDLRTGRVWHKVPTGTSQPPAPRVAGAGETRVIVVKKDGSVAWINDTFQKENRF